VRIVIQRVISASVAVEGVEVGAIATGLMILLGVRHSDSERDAEYLAQKAIGMRIFNDDAGKMNLCAADVGGQFLIVSQFTLYADTSRGRRPSFIESAGPEMGEKLYEHFVHTIRSTGAVVATGRFGAHMDVSLVNDGPVTIIVDSEGRS
jgi:D-tyrosyl-tRNA(Tyr) deacylase